MILTTERQKKIKNIWIKIEVEKEIERKGDNISKILLELPEKKTKNFIFGMTFLAFF